MKLQPYGIEAVVKNYDKFLKEVGGMGSAVTKSHSQLSKLGGISLGGIATTAGIAAGAVVAIGTAAVAAGALVGKTLLDISEKAAPMIDIQEAFELFTAQAGQAGDEVLALWKKASAGVVTNIDLMATYNAAMRRLGTELGNELPKAFPLLKKAAESMGLSFADFTTKLINGVGRLRTAQLSMLGVTIDLNELTEAYAKSIGKEAKDIDKATKRELVMREALRQLGEEYGDLVPTVEEADDVFERMRVSWTDAKDTIRLGIAQAMIPLAQQFEGLLRGYLPGFIDLVKGRFIPALQRLVGWFQQKIPKALQKMWTAYGKVIPKLQKFGAWLKDKFYAANILIAKALAWLRLRWDAMATGIRDDVIPALRKVWDWLGPKLTAAFNFLWPIVEKVITFLGDLWDVLWDFDRITLVDFILGLFPPETEAWIREKVALAWEIVKTKWTEFKDWVLTWAPGWIDTIREWATVTLPVILERIRTAWEDVKTKWAEFTTWLTEWYIPELKKKVQEAKDSLTTGWDKVVSFWNDNVKPAFDAIVKFFDIVYLPLMRAIGDVVSAVFVKSWENLVWLWENSLKPAVEGLLSNFGILFGDMKLSLPTWQQISDFIEGMGVAIAPLVEWLGKFADTIRNMKIPDWLKHESPSEFEQTLWGIRSALASIRSEGGMGAIGLPQRAGVPATAGGGMGVSNAFNLTVNSSSPREPIVADFRMMQALARRR